MKNMECEDIHLVEPTEELREAYLDFIEECCAAGETEPAGSGWHSGDNFDQLLSRLRNHAQGKNLPTSLVPASTYWLVRQGRVLGTCDLRHRLTEGLRDFGGHIGYSVRPSERNKGYGTLILKLALEKARQLGIKRVLITCGKDNIASARVIQKHGGVLDSESYCEQAGRVTQRYWIELYPSDK